MAIKMFPKGISERALLIEWNMDTGERAGSVDPRDPYLQCHGWQNMDVTPAIELRIVEDNRDLSQYEGISGITILNGKIEINTAIDTNFSSKYLIEDEFLSSEHFKQEMSNGNIIIADLPDDRRERLKKLKEEFGIKGIRKTNPNKV